jgi:hypothetical protein
MELYLMKLRLIVTAGFLSLCSLNAFANETDNNSNRIAIQAALATGGTLGIGLVDYTEKTELGLSLSGNINNSSNETKTITPVVFGGLRKALGEQTYFAYGLNLVGTYGRNNGQHINSDYQIGPYISLEQMLTTHMMLSGWIEPYQYQYQKIGGVSTSTHDFFNAGGLAINYLF